mgnify:CR=1 FL=1
MRYTGPTQYLVLLQDAHFRENRVEFAVTVKVVLLKFKKITRMEIKILQNYCASEACLHSPERTGANWVRHYDH